MTEQMPADVASVLATTIGSIPGCVLGSRIPQERPHVPLPGQVQYTLPIEGRSPSLHRIDMRVPVRLATAGTLQDRIDDVLGQLASMLEMQRARAAAGLALPGPHASAFPLEVGSTASPVASHLHVDASTLTMVLANETGSFSNYRWTDEQSRRIRDAEYMTSCWTRLRDIGTHVQDLHRAVERYAGGATMRVTDIAVAERSGVRVVEWTQGVRKPGSGATSNHGMLHGNTLRIGPVDLPDTLKDALVGRPLSDLVDIHPRLATRRIRRVRKAASGEVAVTLSPLVVPIAHYCDMVVGDALAHLEQVIEEEGSRP